MGFPKVCFGCSRNHIPSAGEEVVSEDGTKSYHKLCVPKDNVVEITPVGVAPKVEATKVEEPELEGEDITEEENDFEQDVQEIKKERFQRILNFIKGEK